MMKYRCIFLLLLITTGLYSQNFQLHYDFGKQEDGTKRNYFVGTFEFFRPDTLGYTFMFTDFEFNSPEDPKGVSLGYFEISRSFYMPWFKKNTALKELGFHIEYNDGSVIYAIGDTVYGENLRNSWLTGFEYPFKLGNFTLNTMMLYKYIRGSAAPDFQITFVWYHLLFNDRIALTGYLDLWSQDDFYGNNENKLLALYSEPQIWFTITPNFCVGSEFKISKNFVPGSDRIEVFPTLGVKWQF
ncbi:MAG: DUF5020 family protein [Bacteroidales bacterium]|nr:DUF5020 family protein [Bacteroidales bacterium]